MGDNALPIVAALVATVVGLLLTWGAWERQRRQQAFPAVARRAGLVWGAEDPFNCTAVAFDLFRAGDGRLVENVMWHPGDPPPHSRVFDYAWYVVRRDSNGATREVWEYVTCALVQHNGRWPALRVTRERAWDRAVQKLGLPDIELESEDFNRLFVVQCEDPRFATDLLDPQMMELLLGTEGRIGVECRGRFLLLTTERLEPGLFPGLLRLSEELLERVPPVVWELYGRFPEGAGTDAMPVPAEGAGAAGGVLPILDGAAGIWTPTDPMPRRIRDWPLEAFGRLPPADDDREPPETEYDLDGNPVAAVEEDPWGPGRPPAPGVGGAPDNP
ncbi:MAG: DUF3137 domain-containing protein [Acidimicrobiales bacterium]|nr:DUF3137 domain-containing protein [Acidimicrobiales bacterium]